MGGGNSIAKQAVRQGVALGMALFVFAATAQPLESSDGLTHLGFLNNRVYSDTTISAADSPYQLEDSFTVQPGATLTIEPGVVIKVSALITITVNGSLVMGSLGSSEPVVVTSIKDDAYAGDSNHDGSASSPAAGDWLRIAVNGADASLVMENAVLRYGGLSSNMFSANNGASATIASSTFEYSNSYAIAIAAEGTELSVTSSVIRHNLEGIGISTRANASITGSHVTDNSRRGIAIDTNADVANLTITGNTFSGNATAGIDFDDADDTLVAANNWWGSASGPTNAGNPGGTGDAVVGAVTFSPWTNQDPANLAPVLSFTGASGYTADGVEPNTSFVTQNAPVFKVLFSDPESSVPAYVRLVVASSTFAMATSTAGVYEYTPASGAFAKGTYSYHFEASDGISTARLPASGELSFGVKLVPVILVPGILGSRLYDGDEDVWANYFDLITDAGDDFMNVLAMNFNGTSMGQITVGDIIRDAPFTDVFTSLIGELSDAGYAEDVDLFVAPYDWRLDIRTSVQTLADRIEEVLARTGSQQVNVVAHSMGGLLTKQYVLDSGSDVVNKLIFVGTPHLGAPKAAKALLFGDGMGVFRLSPERIQYIGQYMLSVYELLPSSSYIDQMGYYYYDSTQGIIYDYQDTKQFLTDSGLSPLLLDEAEEFHASPMDTFDTSGLDVYNINGCNTPTITRIIKKDDEEYALDLLAGDETVPLSSSDALDVDAGKIYYFNNVKHATMPSADGIRELITQIITDADISLPENATQDSSECTIAGQLVSVHSPVNLHIYDSSGNHVGRGENGDIEYNITGVGYEEIGENKFVFLPTSGGQTYQIELDGTGTGTYSLRVSKIENNQVSESAYYSNLPVNSSTEAIITLAGSVSDTVLQVDQNGTGSFEPAPISAVLDSTQAADTTKPASFISFSGSEAKTTAYENSVQVSISASDDNAGILKTEYSLDNGSTWNNYSDSFILNTIGDTTILYRSTDRAGNVETAKSQTIRITPSAVVIIPLAVPTARSTDEVQSEPQSVPESGVLGEQAERSQNERYTKNKILDALANANIVTLLDYLGRTRNLTLERNVAVKYGTSLRLTPAMTNFIAYGTKSTNALGAGERAGVLHSYQEAFSALPKSPDDWEDVVNIAIGIVPNKRSQSAEQRARAAFQEVYGRDPSDDDSGSVMTIAYGLRPEVRDTEQERAGIKDFVSIYSRLPSSTFDWNILRAFVY